MREEVSVQTVADITAQLTDDPNRMVFHTRFEMSTGYEEGARGNSSSLSEFGKLFLEIRGVAHVQVIPYTLVVSKAQLYDWTELTPQVEDILRHFVLSQRQMQEQDLVGASDAGSVARN
jgi:hypothetical protein